MSLYKFNNPMLIVDDDNDDERLRLYENYSYERTTLFDTYDYRDDPEYIKSLSTSIQYAGDLHVNKKALCLEYMISYDMVQNFSGNYAVTFLDAFSMYKRIKRACGLNNREAFYYVPFFVIQKNLFRTRDELAQAIGISHSEFIQSLREYPTTTKCLEALQQKKNKTALAYPLLKNINMKANCVDTMLLYNMLKTELLSNREP